MRIKIGGMQDLFYLQLCVEPGLDIGRKDWKYMLENMFFKLHSYGLVCGSNDRKY